MEYLRVNRIQKVMTFLSLFLIPISLFAAGGIAVPFEVLRVISADTPGKESLNWAVRSTYFSQQFRPSPGQHSVENRTAVSIGMGYMLTDKFGVGIASELVRSVNDTGCVWMSEMDLEAKLHIVQVSPVEIGLILFSSVPIYTNQEETEALAIGPQILFTLDPSDRNSPPPYRIHFNMGYSLTTDGDRLSNLFLFGVGIELVAKDFTPFMELTTEQAINDSSLSLGENPIRLTPGLKWRVLENINLNFGLDLSLSKPQLPGLKTVEDWKMVLGVSKF